MQKNILFNITNCPSCGSGKIKKVCKDWAGESRGKTYSVKNLSFFECPDCGEKVYDRLAMKKLEHESPSFKNRHKHNKLAA